MADSHKLVADATSGHWLLEVVPEHSGETSHSIKTQNKFVDRDIDVKVNVVDAEVGITSGAVTALVSTTDTTYTQENETPYAITVAADANVAAGSFGVSKAGWVDADDATSIPAYSADTASKTLYIKKGALSGGGTAGADGNIGLTEAGSTAPTTGFYIKASGSGEVEVATEGWISKTKPATQDDVDNGLAQNVGDLIPVKVSTNGDKYYTVQSASLLNDVADTSAFTNASAPVLTPEGYLYITEGYIPNTKISLATLVPDTVVINRPATQEDVDNGLATEVGQMLENVSTNICTSKDSKWLYKTHYLIDRDGKLVAGTMGDAQVSVYASGWSDADTLLGVYFKDEEQKFIVNSSGDMQGTSRITVAESGYIEKGAEITGPVVGPAAAHVPVDVIQLGVRVDGNSSALVQPVIAEVTSSGAFELTTDATQKGNHYFAVNTSQVTGSTNILPTVTTAGYGNQEHYNAVQTAHITYGANPADTAYITIADATHTIGLAEGSESITPATATCTTNVAVSDNTYSVSEGILNAAPGSKPYLTITSSATTGKGSYSNVVKCNTTEGYSVEDELTRPVSGEVSVSVTDSAKYIEIFDGTCF